VDKDKSLEDLVGESITFKKKNINTYNNEIDNNDLIEKIEELNITDKSNVIYFDNNYFWRSYNIDLEDDLKNL
jgi:hypothetical protein